ncbi:unnamed protein product [Rotaria magnacalcarata]|uniref:Poly A polymerase head domain-containing protein n=4 Tax=Rotaria magnacalcarata TaxID=392030 RepID=A0A816SDL7_9BILA|nr:unnamed protein product [Rotaria magnacalcarata]CAF2113228.1 unnamed protein product [Rotaria magnacalcarata]CAF4197688.1 unnamed protein product [Rotaria magnacalcarata]CAF4215280.1 unnamed protein product [Rotaria magnacalcarata]
MSSFVRCYQLNSSDYKHLFSSQLIYLFSLFNEYDYTVRVVGGAVRDILLGVTPHDIDLATNATKNEMLKLIQGDSNIELVYTRAEHFGTLTLIVGTTIRKTFQVTTLKRSITRHGKDVAVEFTDDWSIDAKQRDLSINSLSMDEHGIVYDYLNGMDDLKMNRIRFNGNISKRLEENPIRILRYFRFFGRLSTDPHAHDPDVLEAIQQCGITLQDVPGEKIWIELKLIIRGRFAGHIMRTILEQRLGPILGLPESLVEMFELENRWLRCMNYQPEPMTLLVTLFNDQEEFDTFCKRAKCSSRHKNLGQFLLDYRYSLQPMRDRDLLYSYKEFLINSHQNQQDIRHQYIIELLKYQGYIYLIDEIKQWSIPKFPIDVWDLQQNGLMSSRSFSYFLRHLKEQWKSSHFQMTKEELIQYGFQSGLFYS